MTTQPLFNQPTPLYSTNILSRLMFGGDRVNRMGTLPSPDGEIRMDLAHQNIALKPSLIGRTKELATLQRYYGQALHNDTPMVLIEGEAGIGKTHLLHAFMHWAQQQGARVLYTVCREAEVGLPYGSLFRMLRLLLGRAQNEWDPAILEIFRSQTWLPILLRLIPEVTRQLSMEPTVTWATGVLTPGQVHEGLGQILRAMADEQPLVLVLDDLHWADTASLALWSAIYRRLRSAPVLMIGTYRPEEVDQAHPLHQLRMSLFHFGGLLRIRLRPLEETAVQELIANLALAEAVTPQEGQPRPEGSPAYWVAWARLVAHHKPLPFTPRTLREINELWIAHLDPDTRRVLEAEATLGIEADSELLAAVAGLPQERVTAIVEQLSTQGVITAYEDTYVIADTVLARTVYEMLHEEQRQQLHLRAGQALEQRFSDLPDVVAAMLARHYDIGGRPNLALRYMMLAGSWARRFFALEEAQELYWNALSQAVLVGDTAAQTTIHEALGDIHAQMNHHRAALEHFRAALGGASTISQQALIRVHMARSLGSIGEYEQAHTALREALQVLARHRKPQIRSIIWLHLSWVEERLGNRATALSIAKRALKTAQKAADPLLEADVALQLALLHWQQQHLDQARSLCQRSLQIREEADDQLGCARVWSYLGMIEKERGDLAAARHSFAMSATIYHNAGEWASEATVRACLGEVCAAANALTESVEQFRQAFALFQEVQNTESGLEVPLWTHPRFD